MNNLMINPTNLERLENHQIFKSLNTLQDLRVFMEHHVFAVWDFMSLLKTLQQRLAPHGAPWVPEGNNDAVRFINEIVLEEESDLASPESKDSFASHFEIYLNSMAEVGASTSNIDNFLKILKSEGLKVALDAKFVPACAQKFILSTFETIDAGKVHEIAAAFAYGRENLVPMMFLRILKNSSITETHAPLFHYYLERHAHLDGEQHGPMADKLVSFLTDNDSIKTEEAKKAAEYSVNARIELWDSVLAAIPKAKEHT